MSKNRGLYTGVAIGFFLGLFGAAIIGILLVGTSPLTSGILQENTPAFDAPQLQAEENPHFKSGYTWSPFKLAFYEGDRIQLQRQDKNKKSENGGSRTYQLRVKKGLTGFWEPIGSFSEEMPSYVFHSAGMYSLHVDEKNSEKVKGTWIEQFFVAPSEYRKNLTIMLRVIVSHHISRNELADHGLFYRGVAQETLLALLVMYKQYKGISSGDFIELVKDFRSIGLEISPRTQDGVEVAAFTSKELGEITVDLGRHTLQWGNYTNIYDLSSYDGIRSVFDKTSEESLHLSIAAALTYIVPSHFEYSVLPSETIAVGYPSLIQNFGHCVTYQDSLYNLLKSMGYTTRNVGIIHNHGASHAVNEIAFQGGFDGKNVYTFDSLSSVYFRGSTTDMKNAGPPVLLPPVSIMADILWNPESASCIRPETIEEIILDD